MLISFIYEYHNKLINLFLQKSNFHQTIHIPVALKGVPPPKNEKKSLFQFLLNLKLENICELMQKTASPYLSPFQNDGRLKLTHMTILLYKSRQFLGQNRACFGLQ